MVGEVEPELVNGGQEKLMTQTRKMAKNPQFGPFLAHLAQFWAENFFFRKSGSAIGYLDAKYRKNLMVGMV